MNMQGGSRDEDWEDQTLIETEPLPPLRNTEEWAKLWADLRATKDQMADGAKPGSVITEVPTKEEETP